MIRPLSVLSTNSQLIKSINQSSFSILSTHRNLLMGTLKLSVWDHNSNTAHTEIGKADRDVLLRTLLRPTTTTTTTTTASSSSSASNVKAVNANASPATASASSSFPLEETVKILFTLNHPSTGERGRGQPWQHTLSTHPINTSYQHTLSTHPINTSYQHPPSTHLINPFSHPPSHPLSLLSRAKKETCGGQRHSCRPGYGHFADL